MKTIFILAFAFLSGCNNFGATASSNEIRAVYLVQDSGELAEQDLRAHPEVIVTNDVNEFKKYARDQVALWIDGNAVNLVSDGWLDQAPQAYYPIVLVGYNDLLYSFRDQLKICCFAGPAVNRDANALAPGFSVMLREKGDAFPYAKYRRAFKQVPTVTEILAITNGLLDGTIRPTPTPTDFPIPTPSPAH